MNQKKAYMAPHTTCDAARLCISYMEDFGQSNRGVTSTMTGEVGAKERGEAREDAEWGNIW